MRWQRRKMRTRGGLIILLSLIGVSFICGQAFAANDDEPPKAAAVSESIMPVPPKIESEIPELEYRKEGCDQSHPCPVGQTCLYAQCPTGVVSETGCGTCVDLVNESLDGEEAIACAAGETLENIGGRTVCIPNECDQCAGDPAYECNSGTNYKCVKHECPVAGSSWNGSACVCENGDAPVNNSCDQLIFDDKKDPEYEEVCRQSTETIDVVTGCGRSTTQCDSGNANVKKYKGEIIRIYSDREESTGQDCDYSSPEIIECCDLVCPGGTVSSSSECGDCYREASNAPGCYECANLQTRVTPESDPCSGGTAATSLSSCQNSCGWQATKTTELTEYSCPSSYSSTGSLQSVGGEEVTVYCCANISQGSGCYDPASGQILSITGDVCTELSTGNDSKVTTTSATVTCSGPLSGPGASGSQGSAYIQSGSIYPLCTITECTEEEKA